MPLKIKRLFPLITLSLLSIGAAVVTFLILWAQSTDSANGTEAFSDAVGVAVFASIAITLMIWVGAGLEFALSFITKNTHRILASVLVFLFLPGLCCFVLPALFIIVVPGVLTDWTTAAGILTGVLGLVLFLPAVIGFIFIYLGAGTSFLSRWLANRIWHEVKEEN